MAEETDKNKKTKAKLIKRSQGEENVTDKKSSEQSEHRKVKIVMKKPPPHLKSLHTRLLSVRLNPKKRKTKKKSQRKSLRKKPILFR